MPLTRLHSIAVISLILFIGELEGARRPQYGGMLRMEMRASFAAIDPAETPADPTDAAARSAVLSNVFETLVRLDEKGQPQPLLAVSWSHEAARKRWAFTVRPHVLFHNGAPWEPAGGAIFVDDRRPLDDILRDLARPRNSIVLRAPDGSIQGTGPFRVAAWDSKKLLVLEAHEAYWGGRPFLDRIELRLGRTEREQAVDFETSRADIVDLPLADVRAAETRGARVRKTAPATVVVLAFDPAKPDLERTRQALAAAIDRPAIQAVILQKQAEISGALLPQWLSGYAFVFAGKRDLSAARLLAGSPQTASFLYDRQNPLLKAIAERITLNAAEAGIALRPVPARPADIRLAPLPISSSDPKQALAQLASDVQGSIPEGLGADPQALYQAERSLIESRRLLPLFHLPGAWQLRSNVHGWESRRTVGIEWDLANLWLGGER